MLKEEGSVIHINLNVDKIHAGVLVSSQLSGQKQKKKKKTVTDVMNFWLLFTLYMVRKVIPNICLSIIKKYHSRWQKNIYTTYTILLKIQTQHSGKVKEEHQPCKGTHQPIIRVRKATQKKASQLKTKWLCRHTKTLQTQVYSVLLKLWPGLSALQG